MYESPIEVISNQLRFEYENNIMKAVLGYGINVNKEELIKALKYDRDQYKKGYEDGRRDALNKPETAEWKAYPDECEICATVFECSCCGETFCTSELTDKEFLETMKFCPNCGAAMRDETESDFPDDYTFGY